MNFRSPDDRQPGTDLISRPSHDHHFLFPSYGHGIVAGDWTVDQFLLYHFVVGRVVCGDLRFGGEVDGWILGGVPATSSEGPEG